MPTCCYAMVYACCTTDHVNILYEEDVAVKWIMCSFIIHEILSDQSISRWDLLIAQD